jgi:hypothetical protein
MVRSVTTNRQAISVGVREHRKYKRGSQSIPIPVPGEECAGEVSEDRLDHHRIFDGRDDPYYPVTSSVSGSGGAVQIVLYTSTIGRSPCGR